MAYQALYNKYRPQTFAEVVGQKSIVQTLKNAIAEDKIAHAYLFCGPRGTGKTTMARLFAKALDCLEGLGEQCLTCQSCKAIASGEHPDVVEIDAASNSSVDSVRQLIDNVSYQPILSRYKVYIIDEVHNMSTPAFNALLKTLEEPPSFVIFILCTTDPQKIIPTILSRVQRFNFSKVSKEDLIFNLKRVLKAEKIDYEEEALESIAALSDGGVRDSLSLLDQLVSYCDGKILSKDVDELFGLLSRKDELSLLSLIEKKDTARVLKLIREKYHSGMNVLRLHDELIDIYKDLLILKTTKDPSLMSRLTKEEATPLLILSNSALRDNIDLLIQKRRDYRYADSLLSHLELTLMSMTEKENYEPTPTPSPRAEEKKTEPSATIESTAVEITSTPKERKVETPEKKKETIHYELSDIVNLMNQASKEERLSVSSQWEKLTELFFDQRRGYKAKALYSAKLRLVSQGVLVLTTKVLSDLEILKDKAEQESLSLLAKEVFQKDYDILAISDEEFKEALNLFRSQGEKKKEKCNIDFGRKKATTGSTAFFQELMQDKED